MKRVFAAIIMAALLLTVIAVPALAELDVYYTNHDIRLNLRTDVHGAGWQGTYISCGSNHSIPKGSTIIGFEREYSDNGGAYRWVLVYENGTPLLGYAYEGELDAYEFDHGFTSGTYAAMEHRGSGRAFRVKESLSVYSELNSDGTPKASTKTDVVGKNVIVWSHSLSVNEKGYAKVYYLTDANTGKPAQTGYVKFGKFTAGPGYDNVAEIKP